MAKQIYKFSGTECDWDGENAKTILGGKGAGLVMMAKDGLPVPPGFTITTEVCNKYRKAKNLPAFWEKLNPGTDKANAWLTNQFGFAPLVSVRSGAPVSMPGMMDTILNVGLTSENFTFWANRLGERAAFDSYRRLVQMLGHTAYDIPMEVFDFQLASVKKMYAAKSDTDLSVEAMENLLQRYINAFEQNKGFPFPDTREVQMSAAIKAVFDSWMSPRAIEYRKINSISDDMGTAVTVQAMVFGNMGDDSGTGVLFTRNPATGEFGMTGEFLTNAQGEDVVAGIRTPLPIDKMSTSLGGHWAKLHYDLQVLCGKLETVYNDMVDIEFTVQQGNLFVLQSRTGKRSARAAFKIAVDMVDAGAITIQQALKRITTEQFKTMRRPQIDPAFKTAPDHKGIPACPGVTRAKAVFSSEEAVASLVPCILVTYETSPNDIAGMAKALGIVTAMGGATSHAAVVARAMDKPCVVGCGPDLLDKKALWDMVALDGSTGNVWINTDIPVIDSHDAPEVLTVINWSFETLQAIESVPVDIGMMDKHHIMAAHWWGDLKAMDAVLVGLAKLPARDHITLDMRSPADFKPDTDKMLDDCFGPVDLHDFGKDLRAALVKRAQELKGLRVAGQMPLAMKPFYHAANSPLHAAIPADYACFLALQKFHAEP